MKSIFVCILGMFVLCGACNSAGKSSTNSPAKKYINVVENVNGYNVVYTEDGHTMLYKNDSMGKYFVFYVKFENRAGKYGLKSIEERIVMAEMNTTLTTLNSFATIQGGAFCKVDSLMRYNIIYYDEQLKSDSLVKIMVSEESSQTERMGVEQEVKRIPELLNIAHDIAQSINKNNQIRWSNIIYALEPTQDLLNVDVIVIRDIYDQRVQKRLPRMRNLMKELMDFHTTLQEEMIIKNKKTIQ